jgi:hypothetical protein
MGLLRSSRTTHALLGPHQVKTCEKASVVYYSPSPGLIDVFRLRVEMKRRVCDSSSTNGDQWQQCGEKRDGHNHKTYHEQVTEPVGGHFVVAVVFRHKKDPGDGGVAECPHITNGTSTRPYLKPNPSYSLWTPMVRHRAAVCGTYTSRARVWPSCLQGSLGPAE